MVVWLLHINRPVEALPDEEGEPGRMLHDPIGGSGLVGELEPHTAPLAHDPHPGIRVESARRGVGTREDLDRPLRERQHGSQSRLRPEPPRSGPSACNQHPAIDGFGRYHERMETGLIPQPVHEDAGTQPAPDDLELVRSFLSLHDHEHGDPDGMPPSLESLRWWLGSRNLLLPGDAVKDQDLAWALRVREALITKVRENMGMPRDAEATAFLNHAAEDTGLRVCFGCSDGDPIHVEAPGVRGAIGRILGSAFLAELDGRWERFRVCHDPGCTSVFFDRSKNKSGKWCSMSSCGNRAKVRAFRARQAAE